MADVQPTQLQRHLLARLADLEQRGLRKKPETVIAAIEPARGRRGPRYRIAGHGNRLFLRMNANAYLGMALQAEVVEAEADAARAFGTGPGAVRFISGTYRPHVELEQKLARFHQREAGMIFSSAYAAVVGVLAPLIEADTIVVSDALNHNCIINAIRLSRPKDKAVYRHLDMGDLEQAIATAVSRCRHLVIVTDGVFSMRGDHAPLAAVCDLANKHAPLFERGITTVVDDSHGVGAFGATGRGTEEVTGARGVDILVATLGKALGVNGGYVVAAAPIIDYLRETSPFYIYSNPISPGEAAAAGRAVDILDSPRGRELLAGLRHLTRRLKTGLTDLGFEVLAGDHPVVPLMIRDTAETAKVVRYLADNGILATGLNYPVVPKGDEEIRFQVSADHTEGDIDTVLAALSAYRRR